MKAWLSKLPYAGLATLLGLWINDALQVFPALADDKWFIRLLALFAFFSKGVFGLWHRMEFGEAQAPAARTVPEVMQAAVLVKAGLIAAAPTGTTVTVPTVTTAPAKGTGGVS